MRTARTPLVRGLRAALVVASLALLACTSTPAPPVTATAVSPFTPSMGHDIASRYKVAALASRRFTHREYWNAVLPIVQSPSFRVEEIGRSVQNRELRAVSYGRGPLRVLLWSQMHGDESTATMALADIFRFLAEAKDDQLRLRLMEKLTIVFVPMLNPDGAELFQRENALGIDVNRDARRLVTPEARALKALRDRFGPGFGFNLHDQNARTRAGENGPQAAIALLAPAYDASRKYNPVREQARQVAATIAALLAPELRGRVARYDDTFNPRAFGDLIQQWGTSTVLIESGALPNDPQKQQLRAHNVVAILGALDAIATGSFRQADARQYETLPENAGGAYDLLITGGRLALPGQWPTQVDLGINYDVPLARTGPRIREIGDLAGVAAIDTIDLGGLYLHPDTSLLTRRGGAAWLRVGVPAIFTVRQGPERSSPLVRQIP